MPYAGRITVQKTVESIDGDARGRMNFFLVHWLIFLFDLFSIQIQFVVHLKNNDDEERTRGGTEKSTASSYCNAID